MHAQQQVDAAAKAEAEQAEIFFGLSEWARAGARTLFDGDGGFDADDDDVEEAASRGQTFHPSTTFQGAREGCDFKCGPQGVGYYGKALSVIYKSAAMRAWEALPASQKMRNVERFVNSDAGRKAKAEAEQAEMAALTAKLAANKLVDGWQQLVDAEKLSDKELISAIVRDRWSLRSKHQYGWTEICFDGEAFHLNEQSREKFGTTSFTEAAQLVRWVRKTAVSVKWEWKSSAGDVSSPHK
jgi:hypothetical protein